jgi:hypothetical protein
LKDERPQVRHACVDALGTLRGALAARVAAPLLTRGECPAAALRAVASATSRRLRRLRGLRAQRSPTKKTAPNPAVAAAAAAAAASAEGASGGTTIGTKSLWKATASSVVAAARLQAATGSGGSSSAGGGSSLGSGGEEEEEEAAADLDGESSIDEGSLDDLEEEMVRLGEPLLDDVRAEVTFRPRINSFRGQHAEPTKSERPVSKGIHLL